MGFDFERREDSDIKTAINNKASHTRTIITKSDIAPLHFYIVIIWLLNGPSTQPFFSL